MSLNGGNSSAWELRFEVENRWLGIGNGDVSARLFVSAAETPSHRLLRAVEARAWLFGGCSCDGRQLFGHNNLGGHDATGFTQHVVEDAGEQFEGLL